MNAHTFKLFTAW